MLSAFCRAWGRRGPRTALLAVAALLALFTVVSGTERALAGPSEFMGYRRIVQVGLIEGKDHYVHIAHVRAYPPFFAIFWVPFGGLPVGLVPDYGHPLEGTSLSEQVQLGMSAAALLLLMTAMIPLSARCIRSACAGPDGGDVLPGAPALVVALTGLLALNGVVRCENDILILMMMAGAMYLMFATEQDWAAGALLGLAAAVKLTPGLFGVYLLCRRKWRALGGMIAAGIVCTMILPAAVWGPREAYARHRSWIETVLVPYATAGPDQFIGRAYRSINQSPKAALVRYLTPYNAGKSSVPRYVNFAELAPETVNALGTAVKVAILGTLLVAWLLPHVRKEGETGPILFALVPLGMLLLSDVSHGSHLTVLMVPIGALAVHCLRRTDIAIRRTMWTLAGGVALVHLIGVQWLKEMSVGTAGVLVLWGGTLAVAWRLHRESRRGGTSGDVGEPGTVPPQPGA